VTDRLFLLYFLFCLGAPFRRYARRLWTCHRRWAPAAGCGVFLCELVPSGDPFVCCLCETFFLCEILFSNGFFIFSEKQIKFATSSTTAAVQSKSNSHVNVYCQPVEFTSFCLVCSLCAMFYVVFEEAEGAGLRPPFGLTTAPATVLGGCWCRGGAGTSQVVSKWRATSSYKIGQKIAIPRKATDRLLRAFWVNFCVFNGHFRQYFQNLHHLLYGFRKY
jgi:hypothetical protein